MAEECHLLLEGRDGRLHLVISMREVGDGLLGMIVGVGKLVDGLVEHLVLLGIGVLGVHAAFSGIHAKIEGTRCRRREFF